MEVEDMDAIDLIKVFSAPTYKADYATAKAENRCVRCGDAANIFRDASAKVEYMVSALCQHCQDEMYKH
jgi:ribosomal protein S14